MKLAEKADVIVENFRSEVKFRLGVDYESVEKINPRIVYGSISGFGQTGPYAKRPGVDQIAQGMGGLMSITGCPAGAGAGRHPDRRSVRRPAAGAGHPDGAVRARATGEGQWVHTSLLEAQIFMLDFQASRWLMAGEVAKQAGNDHPTGIPTGVFPTADGQINIAASGDICGGASARRPTRCTCSTIPITQRPGALEKPQGAERAHRARSPRKRPSAYWVELMNEAGVPCGPIYTIDQTFADPQVRASRDGAADGPPQARRNQGRRPGDQHDPTRRSPRSCAHARSRPAHRGGAGGPGLRPQGDRSAEGSRRDLKSQRDNCVVSRPPILYGRARLTGERPSRSAQAGAWERWGVDVKTLFLINIAVLLVSAAVSYYFWRQHRDNVGLLWWAFGTGICTPGIFYVGYSRAPAPYTDRSDIREFDNRGLRHLLAEHTSLQRPARWRQAMLHSSFWVSQL